MLARSALVVIDGNPDGFRWSNPPTPTWHDDPTGDAAGRATPTDGPHQPLARLVADLAGRFITTRAPDIDTVIAGALRELGELLHLDRAILWQKTADAAGVVISHFW